MKSRALIGLSILLVSTPSMAQAVTQKELSKFVPSSYRIVKWVEADLNGDKQKDVVIAVEAKNIRYGYSDNPPAKILVLFRKGKILEKAWEFSDGRSYVIGRGRTSRSRESLLQIEDLNRDEIPELLFSMAFIGASDAAIETYVFMYHKKKFVSLLETPLSHPLDGGVVIRDLDKSKKGKELMLYYAIWGEGEAHIDLHRYGAVYYAWNSMTQKYYPYKRIETRQKGRTGLKELVLNKGPFWQDNP